MYVLIACEESQRVCAEFRRIGHEAYSCDILSPSGGHPEWHIQADVLPLLHGPQLFMTVDGITHVVPAWDIIIAHPPCTFLTVTGNRWFNEARYGEYARQRKRERENAVEFFMQFANTDCEKIAIENPVGCISTRWRTPDQVIQPYEFGDPYRKTTCLWLKGLPPLTPTKIVTPEIYYYVSADGRLKSDCRERSNCKKADRARHRSKTFPGIARAMAEQWGGNIS